MTGLRRLAVPRGPVGALGPGRPREGAGRRRRAATGGRRGGRAVRGRSRRTSRTAWPSSWRRRAPRAGRSGPCSRRRAWWRPPRRRTRSWAARAGGCWPCRRTTSPACRCWSGRWWAGPRPRCSTWTAGSTWRASREATERMAAADRRYTALVPTQLTRLLDDPAGIRALRSYDAVLVGGAATSAADRERARHAGVRMVTTYGMSETAGRLRLRRAAASGQRGPHRQRPPRRPRRGHRGPRAIWVSRG